MLNRIAIMLVLFMGITSVINGQTTEKLGKRQNANASRAKVRTNTLNAARDVLRDRSFRKSLIMDSGYPNQLMTKYSLSSLETAAICVLAMRINTDENSKLTKGMVGMLGVFTTPSKDWWSAIRAADSNDESKLCERLETLLGIKLSAPK